MKITTTTLRKTKKLLAVRDALRIDADDETVLALAERAAAKGDNPPALFRWMLTHPGSWKWLTEQDRARANDRLSELRPAAKTNARKQTYVDWLTTQPRRRQRGFGPPAATTGWQKEAEIIARMHDERLRQQERRERWGRGIALATLAAMFVWSFW